MQMMRSTERLEFEPLFPVHRPGGPREESNAPEVVAALEKLAESITLLAEMLSDTGRTHSGSQKPASAEIYFPGI
jgi:hypothetical protein